MQQSLVMTLIGKDRPGLVDSLATLVADHGGNWLESRMARLGGQFAGIVRVQAPAAASPDIARAVQNLSAQGLNVTILPDPTQPPPRPQRLSTLEIVGQDRPGIVRQIAHALANQGVNVEELQTDCSSAAMSGETLFKARARLNIPESCNVTELRQTLERIADDLIVDVTLEPLAP